MKSDGTGSDYRKEPTGRSLGFAAILANAGCTVVAQNEATPDDCRLPFTGDLNLTSARRIAQKGPGEDLEPSGDHHRNVSGCDADGERQTVAMHAVEDTRPSSPRNPNRPLVWNN